MDAATSDGAESPDAPRSLLSLVPDRAQLEQERLRRAAQRERATNPRKRERPTSPDSPVTPAVKVPLRAGAPLSSASAPSSGEKHSSDVTVPAPVRAALQDSDMRFAPISSSDRFWRGAIKVRAFTLTDTGRIQSLRTCVALWNAPRASAFASNRDGRGWSGARTSGVLRRRYRLARAHYPSRRAGLVRRQSAYGRSARSIRAASWVLP